MSTNYIPWIDRYQLATGYRLLLKENDPKRRTTVCPCFSCGEIRHSLAATTRWIHTEALVRHAVFVVRGDSTFTPRTRVVAPRPVNEWNA